MKKGFTLIELLAVIIILGILMLIAIPSVTNYINSSRKEVYVDTSKQLIEGASRMVTKGSISIDDKDTTYYIPCDCIMADKEWKSPYGDFDPAYVAVTLNSDKQYDYYFVGKDSSGIGIPILTRSDLISTESLVTDISQISTSVGIRGNKNIVVFNKTCTGIEEEKKASKLVPGDISKPREVPPVSTTIYWALQDNDGDSKYEKLIISSSEVQGNLKGNFPGTKRFNSSTRPPWFNNASYLTSIVIEGTVAPVSTAWWFCAAGNSSSTFIVDLSNLETGNVTDMDSMFMSTGQYATTWSIGDISNWDTSKVTNMSYMFIWAGHNAHTFDIGDIGKWDVSNVTDMSSMFGHGGGQVNTGAGYEATTWYIGDLSYWDVSKVTNMESMFAEAGYSATIFDIGDLSNWDTSSVTNMNAMFDGAGYKTSSFHLNLSNWDTSKVTKMYYMFSHSGYLSKSWNVEGLDTWDVSKVTTMADMFLYAAYKADSFVLDLSSWNPVKLETMYYTFCDAGYSAKTWSIGDVSQWNTSNLNNFYSAFNHAAYNAVNLSLDLSGWKTSKVTNMAHSFYQFGYKSKSLYLDLSGWNFSRMNTMDYGLYYTGYYATTFTLKIPKTNSNGLNNTTSKLYGSSSSYSLSPPSGKSFTLAV